MTTTTITFDMLYKMANTGEMKPGFTYVKQMPLGIYFQYLGKHYVLAGKAGIVEVGPRALTSYMAAIKAKGGRVARLDLALPSGAHLAATATPNEAKSPWQPSGIGYTVKATYNGETWQFSFWDSHHNMTTGQPCDLRGALNCWATDVYAAMNAEDAADIMAEFGYTDPAEARRVFAGVKQAEKQAERIGITDEDLAYLADY